MMTKHLRALPIAALLATAFTLTACGGGSSGGGEDGAGDGASPVVGIWRADAAALLAANTAALGGAPGINCTGIMQLRFEGNGNYDVGGDPVCSSRGISAEGTIVTTGRYSVSGSQLTFSNSVTSGGVTLGTRTIPISFIGDGSATYSISGNTLTLTFSGGSAGTITQQWNR